MEQNPNIIENCPVLKPTMKEFKNFEKYISELENKYSKDYGMVKVVAPRSWQPRKQDYDKSIENCNIPNPIEQNCYGKGGIYEVLHIIKKSMQMKDFVKKSAHFNKITQGKSDEELEQLYWKNISFSPPLYGADFQYTLFDNDVCWNTSNLDDLLSKGINGVIAGVNTPYLYVGQWKSLFAWHTEDMNLGALNYLHHGEPKFWYSIAQSDGHKLEKMAKSLFPESFGKCSQFLRHKTTIINPYLLKKKFPDLKITKCVHNPREFMIVFNGAYHSGFNLGYNIAESVNYATPHWLEHFADVDRCRCDQTQVQIDKFEFYNNITQKYPEYKNNPQFQKFYERISQSQQQQQIQYSDINQQHLQQDLQIQNKIIEEEEDQQQYQQLQNQSQQKIQQSPVWDENTATTNDETLDKESQKVNQGVTKKIQKKATKNQKQENQQQQQKQQQQSKKGKEKQRKTRQYKQKNKQLKAGAV